MKYRWIMYVSQDIPGNLSFQLSRHTSLLSTILEYENFCLRVGTALVSADLYAHSEEDWKSAGEFEGAGCPFDYPSKVITRGPRGSIKVEEA